MRSKLIHIVVFLVSGFAGLCFAGDAGVESSFSAGIGARALGMGGASTSLADDASTIFYNPSGLAVLNYQEVTGMHMTLFEGTLYDYVSWVYPTPTMGGFGLAFMRIGTNDIVKREDYLDVGTFNYSYSQIFLSYGRKLRGGLSAGGSLKIVNQALDTYSDYGIGLDFGMLAEIRPHVNMGIIARDIVPATLELRASEDTLQNANVGESLPVTVVGGIAVHDLPISNMMMAATVFEFEKTENRSTKIHTGAEVVYDNSYSVRAGYDRDNLSLGFGLIYKRLRVDYAYKFLDYITDSHRFSISYLIGTSVPEQIRRRELEEHRKGSVLLADERRRQFAFYKDKANEFYRQYRLDSALTYYQRALAFNESDEEIVKTMAAIEKAQQVLKDRDLMLRDSEREQRSTIDAYYEQAQSFFSKEYYPAALDMLGLILDIEPDNSDALALKGMVDQAIANDIESSLKDARKAQHDGNYVQAIELYTRILYLDPDNDKVRQEKQDVVDKMDLSRHLNLGIDLFRSGHYPEARQKFMLVLSAKPDEPIAKEYLGRIDIALAHPPTLVNIQRDRMVWQYYLDGLRYMRNKEYQSAIEAWEKVLEAYPNNESTLDNLEQARLRLKLELEK